MKVAILFDAGSEEWSPQDVAAVVANVHEVRDVRVLQASGEPIRNPVDGTPQRARINLPDGFEFLEAEVASGSFQTQAALKLRSKDSHGHLAHVNFTGHGIEP